MTYSYDRNRTAAEVLPWGSSLFEWMEKLCNAAIIRMGHTCSGKITWAKASTKYGVFATVDDAELRGDLSGTIFVTVEWWKDKVSLRSWVDHPQRGRVDLIKEDLAYDDRPGPFIDRAVKVLEEFCGG